MPCGHWLLDRPRGDREAGDGRTSPTPKIALVEEKRVTNSKRFINFARVCTGTFAGTLGHHKALST